MSKRLPLRCWPLDETSKEKGMNTILIAIVIAVLAVAGVWVKVWQCGEMFPDASLVACVLWR